MKSNFKVKVKHVNLRHELDFLLQEGFIEDYITINNIVYAIIFFPKSKSIKEFKLSQLEVIS